MGGGAGDTYALYLPLTFSINLKLLRKKEKRLVILKKYFKGVDVEYTPRRLLVGKRGQQVVCDD